jgi:polyisoprenoid-binding protein YceI
MIRACAAALFAVAVLAAGAARADTVLPEGSEIAFTMSQMGASFDGRFRKWKADIVFRPGALAQSRAVVEVDLASIDLASEDSEKESGGPLWFDTRRFPTAHFASTSIRSLGGNRYEVAGRLSIKGITREIVVPLVVSTDAAGHRVAEGTWTLRRLDFKVGEGEWSDTGTVANDVAVRVRMVLAAAA